MVLLNSNTLLEMWLHILILVPLLFVLNAQLMSCVLILSVSLTLFFADCRLSAGYVN
jgi:hypothetical protein